MIIIPAIDLKDGKCVQLVQGRMEDATVFGTDPAEMARRWMDEGARWLHVVDLDGAFAGVSRNIDAIHAIRKAVRIPVELGGGIRTMDAAVRMLDEIGLDRIVLGTAALRDSELVAQVVKRYTDRIAVGIDARSGHVAVSGWAEDTEVSAIALALCMRDMGVKTLIYTDISRDGTLTGPNFDATAAVIRETGIDVILSGGMTHMSNVTRARQIGAAGCIIGTALYRGTIDLAQAIREAEAC